MSRRRSCACLIALTMFASSPLSSLSLLASPGAVPVAAAMTVRALGVGHTQFVNGFAVRLRWVMEARQAGLADYVPARGNIFLIVAVRIRRAGSHGSYYADPQDFHVQTSRGDVIDSEPFGMAHELHARHVYTAPDDGVIGFEVPAKDHHLQLLWHPTFSDNPAAQATWSLGPVRHVVANYL